jgi:hypothetical protein
MRITWSRYLLAALLVLIVGVAWALAEEMELKVEVQNHNGEEVTVDVNGVTEVISLSDLAEGEERTYDVGGHPIVITRVDDQLKVVHERPPAGSGMTWVSADDAEDGRRVVIVREGGGDAWFVGEGEAGDHDVFILKSDDGAMDIEALKEKYGEDFEEIRIGDAGHGMTWVTEGGEGRPIIVKRMVAPGGDMVRYRCEETGSTLRVKKDDSLLDSYIDPVTGCVMLRVEEPVEKVVRVEVIEEKKTAE